MVWIRLYKVKLLFSQQLFYTRSISSRKRRLTPSVPILGGFVCLETKSTKRDRVRSKTDSINNKYLGKSRR